jgi:CheY-like chemotaxis protein
MSMIHGRTVDLNDEKSGRRRQRVLVVEDYVDGAHTMAQLLSVMGHEVQEAFNGIDALRVAADFQPDLILLDIGLPELNGYEVAKQIRENEDTKNIIIAALTGYGRESDRQEAALAGCDHHFTKPIEPHQLISLLSTLPHVADSESNRTCSNCDGSGTVSCLEVTTCPICHGNGIHLGATCLGCGGSGNVELDSDDDCPFCEGQGQLS